LNSIFFPIKYYINGSIEITWRIYSVDSSTLLMIYNICNNSEIQNYRIFCISCHLVLPTYFLESYSQPSKYECIYFFQKTFVNTLIFTIYFYILFNIYNIPILCSFILRIQFFFDLQVVTYGYCQSRTSSLTTLDYMHVKWIAIP